MHKAWQKPIGIEVFQEISMNFESELQGERKRQFGNTVFSHLFYLYIP